MATNPFAGMYLPGAAQYGAPGADPRAIPAAFLLPGATVPTMVASSRKPAVAGPGYSNSTGAAGATLASSRPSGAPVAVPALTALSGALSGIKGGALGSAGSMLPSAAQDFLKSGTAGSTTLTNGLAGAMAGLAASGNKYASIGNQVGSLFGPMGAIAGTVLGGVVSSIVQPGMNNTEGYVDPNTGKATFSVIPGGRDYISTYMFGSDESRTKAATDYYQPAIQKYLETGDKKAAAALLADTGPTGYKYKGDKEALFGRLWTGPNNIGSQIDKARGG